MKKMKVDQSIAKGLLVLNVLNVFLPYIQDLMSEILSAASTHGTLRLSRLSSVTALTRTAGEARWPLGMAISGHFVGL